jgi:hypothetical protein
MIDGRSSRGLFREYTGADPDGERRRHRNAPHAGSSLPSLTAGRRTHGQRPSAAEVDDAARLTARLARTTAGCDAMRRAERRGGERGKEENPHATREGTEYSRRFAAVSAWPRCCARFFYLGCLSPSPSRGSIVNSSTSASGVRPNKGRLLLCSNKTTHTQAKRAQLAKKEHLHSTKRTLVSHPHRLARALAPRPIPAQIRRRNLLRPRRRTGRRDSPSRGSQPRSVLCPTPPPPVVWVSRWGWVIPVQEKKN